MMLLAEAGHTSSVRQTPLEVRVLRSWIALRVLEVVP